MKMIAASMTQQYSPANPAAIIAALSSTERNFLIPKDQKIVAEAAAFNKQASAATLFQIVPTLVSAPQQGDVIGMFVVGFANNASLTVRRAAVVSGNELF